MTAETFNKEYLALGAQLFRVAASLLGNEDDAEDALQDLYIRLWRRTEVLDSVRNPLAYSITLLRNICIDRIRIAGRMRTEGIDDCPAPDASPLPDKDLEDREKIRQVSAAIAALPEDQRRVLEMKVLDGMSYKEISAATGKSCVNLRVLLSKARANLSKKTRR